MRKIPRKNLANPRWFLFCLSPARFLFASLSIWQAKTTKRKKVESDSEEEQPKKKTKKATAGTKKSNKMPGTGNILPIPEVATYPKKVPGVLNERIRVLKQSKSSASGPVFDFQPFFTSLIEYWRSDTNIFLRSGFVLDVKGSTCSR